ncbi:hypothetical protein [Cloacibacillus porcorum]|uniref:hypothetical protein n=1 Tax=Cloacibacillus porcorum TaxID=1197717 RepID=UPI003D04A538
MAKKVVRYKRINGALVKQFEVPPLIGGLVDIASLPIVGTAGSAVIERGSNANGEYVKFADGTMICTFNSGSLGSDESTLNTCVFPAAFVSKPKVYPAVSLHAENVNTTLATGFVFTARPVDTSLTYCKVAAISLNGVPLSNGTGDLIAVGRWK